MATIGIQAIPINSIQNPKIKPSEGDLPLHHWRASKIVSRQNHTDKATTQACA
jgi:hypothetical protein